MQTLRVLPTKNIQYCILNKQVAETETATAVRVNAGYVQHF